VTTTRKPERGVRRLLPADEPLRVLLVFVPLAAVADGLDWGATAVFACSALAIVPLAGLLGHATESLAARLGAGVGGLLNATFGNAAELIIALAALQKGLQDVVKASLTGSIIGNVLLVLGLAMLAGGIGRERQRFDRAAAAVGSTLLALATIGLVIPAVFHFVLENAVRHDGLTVARETLLEHELSVEIAVVLFATYLLHLVFSLVTHRHLYAGQQLEEPSTPPPATGSRAAVVRLLVATALIAWMSELLAGAVEEASHALGLTEVFVGVIVVAIVGNAAEHSTAVLVARKNQVDLAMNIAIGSSIQIALLVAPLLVFVSHVLGPAPMDLRFTVFEVVAIGIAMFVVNLVAQDGESNWLEGALLVAVYAVLGLAFFFLP
jgi:Ca2+:H+ antiporter